MNNHPDIILQDILVYLGINFSLIGGEANSCSEEETQFSFFYVLKSFVSCEFFFTSMRILHYAFAILAGFLLLGREGTPLNCVHL